MIAAREMPPSPAAGSAVPPAFHVEGAAVTFLIHPSLPVASRARPIVSPCAKATDVPVEAPLIYQPDVELPNEQVPLVRVPAQLLSESTAAIYKAYAHIAAAGSGIYCQFKIIFSSGMVGY